MNEEEWLACTDPEKMVQYIRTGKRASPRKLRLFAVACLRRLWHVLEDARCRDAVEVGERFAENHASAAERMVAFGAACKARDEHPHAMFETADDKSFAYYAACFAAAAHAPTACFNCSRSTLHHFKSQEPSKLTKERADQIQFLHDVFGNPFRHIALNSAWLTSDVTAVARVIYEERRFDDLPILADALEESGCTEFAILEHFRGPGPHARGCWPVDPSRPELIEVCLLVRLVALDGGLAAREDILGFTEEDGGNIVEVVTCHNCGKVILADAIKCPHCLAAFQPAHIGALNRGFVLGLILGLPLLILLALCGLILYWPR